MVSFMLFFLSVRGDGVRGALYAAGPTRRNYFQARKIQYIFTATRCQVIDIDRIVLRGHAGSTPGTDGAAPMQGEHPARKWKIVMPARPC
jgi:hypothetical protein